MNNLGDRIECWCGHPLAFWIFTILFGIGLSINIDVTNILISYFTCALLLLTVGSARRSDKATHAKLDELIIAEDKADDRTAHIEDLAEQEIEERRK